MRRGTSKDTLSDELVSSVRVVSDVAGPVSSTSDHASCREIPALPIEGVLLKQGSTVLDRFLKRRVRLTETGDFKVDILSSPPLAVVTQFHVCSAVIVLQAQRIFRRTHRTLWCDRDNVEGVSVILAPAACRSPIDQPPIHTCPGTHAQLCTSPHPSPLPPLTTHPPPLLASTNFHPALYSSSTNPHLTPHN